MKILSPVLFIICAAVLLAVGLSDYHQLPARIASHFGGSGAANGYMARDTFGWTMLLVGLGVPVLVSGIMFSLRFIPSHLLNVPNPEYWRAPQNYRRACDFLFQSSLWFGSAFLLWQAAFSHLIVSANLTHPPHLATGPVALVTSLLLVLTGAWIVVLLLYFLKPRTTGNAPASASHQ